MPQYIELESNLISDNLNMNKAKITYRKLIKKK